jgi:hypothetical protein
MINGKFVPNVVGELRREVDLNGQIVEHRVRNSAYVHDRMHSAGKLAAELYAAAEKFRMDFERAQLSGSDARNDLFRTRAGKGEITDKVAGGKIRHIQSARRPWRTQTRPQPLAILHLECRRPRPHAGWLDGHRPEDRRQHERRCGLGRPARALERLALHYGMLDKGKLSCIRQDQAYSRGIRDFLEFLNRCRVYYIRRSLSR